MSGAATVVASASHNGSMQSSGSTCGLALGKPTVVVAAQNAPPKLLEEAPIVTPAALSHVVLIYVCALVCSSAGSQRPQRQSRADQIRSDSIQATLIKGQRSQSQ